jgi:hypothetical protein
MLMNNYSDNNCNHNNSSEEEETDDEYINQIPERIDYAVDTLTSDLLEFEKDIQNSVEVNILSQPNDKKGSREFTLYINSRDREINGENTTFNFQVITDEQHTPGINNISDIQKIEVVSVMVPNIYLNLNEVLFLDYNNFIRNFTDTTTSHPLRTPRLNGEPYIMIQIGNYTNQNNIGTNSSFRNKSFILTMDKMEERKNQNSGTYELNNDIKVEFGNINNSVLADTDKNLISYLPLSENSISFSDSSNKLTNFTISLRTQNSKLLSYLNDSLIISSITFPSSTNTKIGFEFTKYFSADEYALGDTIIIKPGTIKFSNTTSDLENLKIFLERPEGHTIIQHIGRDDELPILNTRMFKGFHIPAKFNVTNDNGTNSNDIFKIFDFGVSLGTTIAMDNTVVTNNKIINQNNQILITLKITTNEYLF